MPRHSIVYHYILNSLKGEFGNCIDVNTGGSEDP